MKKKFVDEVFTAYDEYALCVSDFDIRHNGSRIDYLVKTEDDDIEFWGGNPFEDKHAEQFIMSDEEANKYLEKFEKLL